VLPPALRSLFLLIAVKRGFFAAFYFFWWRSEMAVPKTSTVALLGVGKYIYTAAFTLQTPVPFGWNLRALKLFWRLRRMVGCIRPHGFPTSFPWGAEWWA